MVTPLRTPLRRELLIERQPWRVTISPEGLTLVRKGRRKGIEIRWTALVNGDAALAAALYASVPGLRGNAAAARRSPSPPVRERRARARRR